MSDPILSFGQWRTNGELIADVAELGYLDGDVIDLSYGRGKFWTKFRPKNLEVNDINESQADWNYDVRDKSKFPLKWKSKFDVAVWDPPYRLSGRRDGRTAASVTDFDARYGTETYRSPEQVQELINAGITFGSWCVRSGGIVLVKCQTQVAGGRKHFQPMRARDHAQVEHQLRLIDQFTMVQPRARKQPEFNRDGTVRWQHHSRSNGSTLLVFRNL